MKILVTGGAGFIGSNFIHYILQKYSEDSIINFDKLTYAGNLQSLKSVENDKRYTFVKGDIASLEDVKKVFEHKPDVVVNFAAESHVDRSITNPGEFIRTNVMGTQILLDRARENKVERFVHISTDEVYGSLGKTGFFTEDTPIKPNSPYSASKASSDLIVSAYFETYKMPVCITRCSNNYGPYQFPEKFVPLFLTNAMRDRAVPLYGDGLNVRDWLYVEDHCSAIDLVLRKGKLGEVYNIGGNNEYTNIDIAKKLMGILGKPESLIKRVKDRAGHDKRYAIDATKITKELGWEPQNPFAKGIVKTVEWYKNNEAWWKPLLKEQPQEKEL